MYGPDDPAYGPPSPGWYSRDEMPGQQAAAGAAGELAQARGPFEPLEHPMGTGRELVSYQPIGYELPGASGEDPVGGGTSPLDQIRDLYRAAEATGPGDLDRSFEQLLGRQRQLISDYFTETAQQEDPK